MCQLADCPAPVPVRSKNGTRFGPLGEYGVLGELQVAADATVVTLHGDLDMVTLEELRGLLDQACDGDPARVVIDLTDVPFVDVLSLSTILASADAVREYGGFLHVRGASGAVRRICAMLNAKDVLLPGLPAPRLAAN